MKKRNFSKMALSTCALTSMLVGCGKEEQPPAPTPANNNVQLRILATTDVHNALLNYDYYTLSESENFGMNKLSTIISKYRDEVDLSGKEDKIDNTIVLDNGDIIQGNPLGDYFGRVAPIKAGEEHPVYKTLSYMGYDVGTLGNHEFNYGLDYIKQLVTDSKVSIINTNVYDAETKEHAFTPYKIIDETVLDNEKNEHTIKVGVLGFVPPQILNWDKMNLEGKVTVEDIKVSAEKYVKKLKEEKVDIIIALCHTGYGKDDYVEGAENVAYELTKVKGLDVIVAGHSHDAFPTKDMTQESIGNDIVQLDKGTINGVVSIQPKNNGESVGIADLTLENKDGKWNIVDSKAQTVLASEGEVDKGLDDLLKNEHAAVIEYVKKPVGETTGDINSYFALVADNPGVQIIADAQKEAAKEIVANTKELQEYKNLPILSASAPFKAGLSKEGTIAADYFNIPTGAIAIKDVANLYKYPNTLSLIKLSGKDLRNWLDMSSTIFNTIDPKTTEAQELLAKDFPAFNFDSIDGVTYEIDLSQPAKYDATGKEINKDASRIVQLKYNDQDVKDSDEFLVVTNNYRASGGGNFPIATDTSKVVYESSDEVRQVVADYIQKQKSISPTTDNNWKLSAISAKGPVTFLSNEKGESYLKDYPRVTFVKKDKDGLALYEIK